MSKINYKDAGVDIDAGNEAVNRIKNKVQSTFSPNVLTGLGGFGSLFNLKSIIKDYTDPVLVQSIDGVGTKTIIAKKLKKFDTIGIDLLSACANDIIVMGAKPLTFLDYIASEKLQPLVIDKIVSGMVKGCVETNVSLVGGETAEMPDTYLKGEHDLVGIITGVVEKKKIITGENIKNGDIVLGLPSSGLHTNGYSLARKLFFDVGGYSVHDNIPGLNKPVGLTLLEPHINYTNHISALINSKVAVNGIAHITGGGFLENIPRILSRGLDINIHKDSFPSPPVFSCMQSLGKLDQTEMYRTFNMGIGMIIVVHKDSVKDAKKILSEHINTYEIGQVINGNKQVNIL